MSGRGGVDLSLFTYWVPVEVRYSDLDAQGVINNATYFTYFEHARVRFFEHLRAAVTRDGQGDDATGYTAADMPFLLARATCAYHRPITGMAPLSVGVRCASARRATIEMEYVICDQPEAGGITYASGATTAVCVDPRTGRPRSLPDWSRRALALAARAESEASHRADRVRPGERATAQL